MNGPDSVDWDQPSAAGAGPGPGAFEASAQTPKLGQSAMVIAICVFAFSIVVSVLVGFFGTTIYRYHNVAANSSSAGFNAHPNETVFGFQAPIGSAFGIWALVQGIVATAQGRGRNFGIVAIILAAIAPFVSLIVWVVVGLAAGHNIYQ
jgi:hypothetical protein